MVEELLMEVLQLRLEVQPGESMAKEEWEYHQYQYLNQFLYRYLEKYQYPDLTPCQYPEKCQYLEKCRFPEKFQYLDRCLYQYPNQYLCQPLSQHLVVDMEQYMAVDMELVVDLVMVREGMEDFMVAHMESRPHYMALMDNMEQTEGYMAPVLELVALLLALEPLDYPVQEDYMVDMVFLESALDSMEDHYMAVGYMADVEFMVLDMVIMVILLDTMALV